MIKLRVCVLPASISEVDGGRFPDLETVDLLVPTLVARDSGVRVVFERDVGHRENHPAEDALVRDESVSAADVFAGTAAPLVDQRVSRTAHQTVAALPAVERLVALGACK